MINPRAQLYMAMALATLGDHAWALSLGDIHSRSRSDQSLRAYVDLYPQRGARIDALTILPDLFDAASRAQAGLLAGIEARVVYDETGAAFVELRSIAPLLQRQVSFRLRAESGGAATVRHYTLDLASPITPVGRTATPRSIRHAAARSALGPTSTGAAVDAATYGPVKSGESLWTIARRLNSGGNPQSLMRRLHAANPEAFVGGDMNRLRVGVTLRIPPASGPAVAVAPVAPTPGAAGFAPSHRPLPTVPAPAVAPPPAVPPKPLHRAERAARGIDPVLAAELAALDSKFAAIRARYAQDETSAAGAALEVGSHSEDTDTAGVTVSDSPTAVEPTAARLSDAGQGSEQAPSAPADAEPAATTTTAVFGQATTKTADADTDRAQSARRPATPSTENTAIAAADGHGSYGIGVLAGGLLLAGVLAFFTGRAIASRRGRIARSDHMTLEADRKARVARKAKARLQMESEVQEVLVGETPGTAAETTDGAPAQSREDEIAAHIAHGRYAQAERELIGVIAEMPRNFNAKLRLAEVYYITEQVQAFGDIATNIKTNHRSELSNDEWQRLMRMGKIIAPDLPLFSGPKAVARRA